MRPSLLSQPALGRWKLPGEGRVYRQRESQRACQPLEAGLGDMVSVRAVERSHMKSDPGIDRKGLEPFAHELGVEGADLLAREVDFENEERAAGDVESNMRQGIVHRQVHVGI